MYIRGMYVALWKPLLSTSGWRARTLLGRLLFFDGQLVGEARFLHQQYFKINRILPRLLVFRLPRSTLGHVAVMVQGW